MRNLRALIFSVLFIQLSCNQHDSSEYIKKLDNPELFQSAMQNLTDIVVYDIFSPPVASRVYLYPTIAAYEIIASHQPESFNSLAGQVKDLNESQRGINKILAGVKKFGTLAEFSLGSLLEDLLPASQYLSNVKMKEDTSENVEFAIKLKEDVLVPVDSHFPVDKFKAIEDAFKDEDKKAAADARKNLAKAFRDKAKSVNDKYINPPKTTDFAIVYAPTESLFSELSSYQDPVNKELLTQEIMKKYKVVILGPNTLSAYLQSLHMGFQTLKVQKHATEIYDHLKTISTRFSTHFDNIYKLRKKLEEAMTVVDSFGKDARSITRTLENIKDPEQIERAINTENVEKLSKQPKQAKN